jgi:hypothetical protein
MESGLAHTEGDIGNPMPRFNVIVITALTLELGVHEPVDYGEVLTAADGLLDLFDRYGNSDATIETDCKCLIKKRRDLAVVQAEQKFGSLEILRAQFSSCSTHLQFRNDESEIDDRWANYILPFTTYVDEMIRLTVDIEVDPQCRMCHGKGKVTMPRQLIEGKFDSYSFDAPLIGNVSARNDRAFKPNNICRVVDIDWAGVEPFAVITPDGEWHGVGSIDVFGVIRGMVDDWNKRWQSEAISHPYNIATVASCHI